MKKVIILLGVLIAAASGAYWYTQQGSPIPAKPADKSLRIGAVLPAKSTMLMGTVEHVDRVLAQVNAFATDIITQLPEEFQTRAKPALDKDARDAFLGFDPMTAAGWSTVGIDAVAGFSITADHTIIEERQPRPLVFLKLTDRAKLIAAFKAKGVAITFTDQKGPSEVMTVAGVQSLVGEKGGYTVVLPGLDDLPLSDALRTRFDAFLVEEGPRLARTSYFDGAAGGMADGGRAVMYLANAPLMHYYTKNVPGGASALPAVDQAYYIERFPAFGLGVAAGLAQAQLVASPAGSVILDKLFRPKTNAKLSQFVPGPTWSALRYSLNLDQVFEGVGDLIPPSKADIKMGLAMGQALIAGQLGISWMDLSAALDGHVLVAVDLASFNELRTKGNEALNWLGVIGLKDPAKADLLMKTLETKLKAPELQGLSMKPIKIEGSQGLEIADSSLKISVVKTKSSILIGPSESIVAASIKASKTGSFSKTDAGKAIDQPGAVSVVVVQLESVLKALQADQSLPDDARKSLDSFLADPKRRRSVSEPNINTVLLDRGLRFKSSGLMALMMMAGMTAAVTVPAMVEFEDQLKQAPTTPGSLK